MDKRRHYLPAATIGYFSAENSPERLRKRMVWVLRKDSDTPRFDKAENVGYGKKIYGYGKGEQFDHDSYFKGAENHIHEPVNQIMVSRNSWINVDDWAKLAWYITIQITRNPDLEHEFEAMSKEKGITLNHASVGYPLNAQRTSTAIIRARWEFIWSFDRDFILGDRGITGTQYPHWKTLAYFLPLRKNFGVILGPAPYKKQLKWFDNSWHIEIPTYRGEPTFTDKLNLMMWHAARYEVYGSSKAKLLEIKASADTIPTELQAIAPRYEAAQLLGLDLHERAKDELLLFSILGGIREPEDKTKIWYLTI